MVFATLAMGVVACSGSESSRENDTKSQREPLRENVSVLKEGSNTQTAKLLENLTIRKNEVDGSVKNYAFEVDGQKMQIMAVKTQDGKIRTAFDTCQVCNGSPKAYYEQDGEVVVCQNCGNRFALTMIGDQRGGCNPIPITPENKTETDEEIIIDKAYIEQNKDLFTVNWRTR